MERLLIFQMNNEDGMVEDYVIYLLNQLKSLSNRKVVIVNGNLKDNEKNKLLNLVDDVIFRANKGYDAEAYRDVILSKVGISVVRQYDELIICNDTFFGFFHSVDRMFDDMEKKVADFWGLTKHAEYKSRDWYMPEHVQSYFLVIKKRMLISEEFEKFWLIMPEITSFESLVKNFENRFTAYFSANGFLYSTYVEDDELNGDSLCNYNHYSVIPYTLLNSYNMPVLKKKNFLEGKSLDLSGGDELAKSLKWISNNTNYDLSMIWDSVIKKFSPADLKDTLNLNFIVTNEEENITRYDSEIVAYITCFEKIDVTYNYLKLIPQNVRVIIFTNKIEVKNLLDDAQRDNMICIYKENIRYGEALLSGCKMTEGKYVCFLHDLFMNVGVEEYERNRTINTIIWENASLGNLGQVEKFFEDNPYLGVLAVPEPIHSYYINTAKMNWNMVFEDLCRFVKNSRLKCKMDRVKPIFAYCGSFWFRDSVGKRLAGLEKIIANNNLSDEAIKYLLICIAQDSVRFSGTIFTQDFASVYIQNMLILLRGSMRENNLINYIKRFKKIFVYGAGKVARKVNFTLKMYNYEVEKFVVSDDHISDDFLVDGKVVPLKDLYLDDASCLVVALGYKKIREVESVILKCDFKHVYYYT